ncbi:hypothetical protein [Sorangium sp. So ce1153]|uniref:hypothetical protein n=1 Tax=Sorangium sp. So ce1153 TaxID=3133333 RepID=UPI003F61ED5C
MWFERRTFNPEHLCFHEALQFFASYFGSVTLCRFPIEEDGIIIKTPGCDQVVTLHGAAEMIGFLTGNSPQPTSLAYSLAPTPIHLPGDPPERTGELPANRIGPTLCVYLLAGLSQKSRLCHRIHRQFGPVLHEVIRMNELRISLSLKRRRMAARLTQHAPSSLCSKPDFVPVASWRRFRLKKSDE